MKYHKFLHSADWHLCTQQYGRAFRGQDSLDAVREVVKYAQEFGVDFVTCGGDILQVAHVNGALQDILWQVHDMFREAGIPCYAVTGNHDRGSPSLLTFPARYTTEKGGLFCIDKQIITVPGTDIRIGGYPACDKQEFLGWVNSLQPGEADFVIWHGAVKEFCKFDSPEAVGMSELPCHKVKAYLLGDIHVHETARLDDGTIVSYPGSTELRDMGETAEKWVDCYALPPGWRTRPLLDPMPLAINTRPVLFLHAATEEQADDAVDRVREIVDAKGKLPMVFLRYHPSVSGVVRRIAGILDTTKTVFRYRTTQAKGPDLNAMDIAAGWDDTRTKALPDVRQVAADMIPPGNPAHELVMQLCNPEANHRLLIYDWAEAQAR